MSPAKYDVFHRTWWREATKEETNWPDGLVPHCGRKTYLRRGLATIEEARAVCAEYNATHAPRRLSRKAEFESV